MNERYPAAPRTFGLREAHWQTIERLSPSAPSRFTAIDLWWEECEVAVDECKLWRAAGGGLWDNRRFPR